MPDLSIQHLIYTRVERAYSPDQHSGYQVVYQSPLLGGEAAQIERYLQCFPTNDQHLERYQFFWTEKGQAVITKSVTLLKPDRSIIDWDQRNAFLAHAIILSKEEFARVQNDPFAVLEAAEDADLFAEDVKRLIAYLRQTPPRERLHVSVRQQSRRLPTGWSNQELSKLYTYGRSATATGQEQSFLMVSANQYEIVALLSTVHLLLTPDERPACTFDTCIDTCSPAAGIFWAIGCTKAVSNAGYIPIFLAEREIATRLGSGNAPDLKTTAYSAWVYKALQSSAGFSEIHNQLFTAQVVSEALTAKRVLSGTLPLNEETLRNFYEANRPLIESKIQTALTALLGRRIAVDLAPSIHCYLPPSVLFNIATQETCDAGTLAPVIYRWLLRERQDFKQWNDLLPFVKQIEYAPLQLLVSVKAQSRMPFFRDETLRIRAIKALLFSQTLPQVLDDLLWTRLAPAGFVTPESATIIMTYIHPDEQVDDEEFQALLGALLRSNVGDRLTEAYIQRAAKLQNKSVILALVRVIKQTKSIVPELQQVLQRRLQEIQDKE